MNSKKLASKVCSTNDGVMENLLIYRAIIKDDGACLLNTFLGPVYRIKRLEPLAEQILTFHFLQAANILSAPSVAAERDLKVVY